MHINLSLLFKRMVKTSQHIYLIKKLLKVVSIFLLCNNCEINIGIGVGKLICSSETLTSEESGSTDNMCTNDYQIYDTLNEIFSAEPDSTANNTFSWKVKDEIHLQDRVIQLVKTSGLDVISNYIFKRGYVLNRGYRIVVILPDQQTKVLAQEKNDSKGKSQIQNRWKNFQALQETRNVQKRPSCTKETGCFQAEVVVLKATEIPVHNLSLCHFQNVYYGTVKPLEALYTTFAPAKNSLYTGMIQCTIPPEQLNHPSNKRSWLKLWPSSSVPQTGIYVNYLNEMEHHNFEEILKGSSFSLQHTSLFAESEILLYIPCSLKSFDESIVQASQLAVDLGFSGKVSIFEWCIDKEIHCVGHPAVVEKAKPQLLWFLKTLCSHSAKVHIIAVCDAALLLINSLTDFDCKLGQVIITNLHRLSQCVFAGLQNMVQKHNSLLFQAENITIYHKPKPLQKSLSLTRSFTLGRNHDMFFKKHLLEPPPFVPHVDIICLGCTPEHCQVKDREYAASKAVIEDMSEIICFGKSISQRSCRVKLQCGCDKLRRPIYRSHLPCMICSCCSNFVIHHVTGLGTFTPFVFEEMEQSLLEVSSANKKQKCSSIHKDMQIEGMLSRQCECQKPSLVTKSSPG